MDRVAEARYCTEDASEDCEFEEDFDVCFLAPWVCAPRPLPPPPPLPPGSPSVNPENLTSRIRDCGWNFNEGDLFGGPRGGRSHTGIDIQTHSDARFFAFRGGTVELPPEQPRSCGWYVRVRHDGGGYEVHCHLDRDSRPAAGTRVGAGDHVGSWGGSGVHGGPHHHFKLVGKDGTAVDPLKNRVRQ